MKNDWNQLMVRHVLPFNGKVVKNAHCDKVQREEARGFLKSGLTNDCLKQEYWGDNVFRIVTLPHSNDHIDWLVPGESTLEGVICRSCPEKFVSNAKILQALLEELRVSCTSSKCRNEPINIRSLGIIAWC
jgi:hypothetical protein